MRRDNKAVSALTKMTRMRRVRRAIATLKFAEQFGDILLDEYPGAIIAGGCLRDFIMERPVKDVDVFIPCWSGWHKDLTGDRELLDLKAKYGTLDAMHLEKKKWNGFDVDLIYIYPDGAAEGGEDAFALWVLDKFDFDLCRIAWIPGEECLTAREEFWVDAANETITLSRPSRGWKDHLERLKIKYPTFEFRGPETADDDIPF